MTRLASTQLICPYCFSPARLTDADEVYGVGQPYAVQLYVCGRYPDCDAYVGVHRNTGEPLGRLANRQLRRAKQIAHEAFDPLWKDAPKLYELPEDSLERNRAIKRLRGIARNRAYKWLAVQMGIPVEETHIGWMDLEGCQRVAEICKNASPEQVRQWAKEQKASETS